MVSTSRAENRWDKIFSGKHIRERMSEPPLHKSISSDTITHVQAERLLREDIRVNGENAQNLNSLALILNSGGNVVEAEHLLRRSLVSFSPPEQSSRRSTAVHIH